MIENQATKCHYWSKLKECVVLVLVYLCSACTCIFAVHCDECVVQWYIFYITTRDATGQCTLSLVNSNGFG